MAANRDGSGAQCLGSATTTTQTPSSPASASASAPAVMVTVPGGPLAPVPTPAPGPELTLGAALRGLRVVTIGGGTGPYALLSLLKRLPCSVTAIVSMVGSGGTSRRLRDEFGQLPVGDLRQALVALSTRSLLWRELFSFRFGPRQSSLPRDVPPSVPSAGPHNLDLRMTPDRTATVNTGTATDVPLSIAGVSGHYLGNLILTALQDLHANDLLHALDAAKYLLGVLGDVVPATLLPTKLCAELADGTLLRGETTIDARGLHAQSERAAMGRTEFERAVSPTPPALAPTPIRRVLLDPPAPACQRALNAICRADLIVIGPGDLYTGVLPTLLVEGVASAIRSSRARAVYVCSLTSRCGETGGLSASDFVREVQRSLGGDGSLDRVVLHNRHFPDHLRTLYTAHRQAPVEVDDAELELVGQLVPEVVVDDLLTTQPDRLVRHDPARLARALVTSFSWPALGALSATLAP